MMSLPMHIDSSTWGPQRVVAPKGGLLVFADMSP